jgi:hypothetical protein
MNENLKRLVEAAGAPEQVMDRLWFAVFCEQFADILLHEVEREVARLAEQ